ncbi:hypothetical protein G7K_2165-t1 [Saitoella complicata NRRL Y-17804]|uniref:Uncharacterized protein n=1 Tax=Saitoella complicata (strain BCRC 22490 / CBS 7301 / JCM 7358 / NBRC 10748 / NRRL Y-17804) TaxID=698492 RepID=A0A0E9NDT7_SAICN|nr:hypothetical protein G7K_2165-t1 [Saitoella complicata NRRL Y-17804]
MEYDDDGIVNLDAIDADVIQLQVGAWEFIEGQVHSCCSNHVHFNSSNTVASLLHSHNLAGTRNTLEL